MASPSISPSIAAICRRMEAFEAAGSVANTGTGARREGEGFEKLIASLWDDFRSTAEAGGAQAEIVAGVGSRRYAKLSCQHRELYVPSTAAAPRGAQTGDPPRWLEVIFGVSDLVASYPGEADAVQRYAPAEGPFAEGMYPTIYSGLSTKFDDTVVLVDRGVLREKILLEYKTAKSTAGRQIDGNAHERLSFQVMQYLEVATRYTKCSLVVIANGAFIRYRNKYHVNFHVQAARLRNFSWFSMEHTCAATEYIRFLEGLLSWLFEGTARSTGKTK